MTGHRGAPATMERQLHCFSLLFLGCLWRLRATVARAPRSPGGFREINTLSPVKLVWMSRLPGFVAPSPRWSVSSTVCAFILWSIYGACAPPWRGRHGAQVAFAESTPSPPLNLFGRVDDRASWRPRHDGAPAPLFPSMFYGAFMALARHRGEGATEPRWISRNQHPRSIGILHFSFFIFNLLCIFHLFS